MLEQIDLKQKLNKKEYKAKRNLLQRHLLSLQRACWRGQVSLMVVIEGWDLAGKGELIRTLTEKLDPRSFKLHAIREPRTYEKHLPWLWRFWTRLPNWGEMAIFDHSWYRRVLEVRIEENLNADQLYRAFGDINSFERTLSDDRYVFAKYFLHIDKKTQKKRLKKLGKDPLTAWRVSEMDWEQHRLYDDYLIAVEAMLEHSETEWAPWTIVESRDSRWARIKVLESLISRMEEALKSRGAELPDPADWEDEDIENGNGDD